MRKMILAAALASAITAVPAFAQDYPADAPATPETPTSSGDAAPGTPAAPDGSKAFGFVPYFGVMGGWEGFDNEGNKAGIPVRPVNTGKLDGGLVQGVVGVNIPLGPLFVGAEGNVAKGFVGDIDWEYGAAGRFGVRAGDSGLLYGKVGYQWVNFDKGAPRNRDYDDITYGVGFEAGPKDIGLGGLTNNAGFRLRGEVSTFGNFHSFRPMLGVITHF